MLLFGYVAVRNTTDDPVTRSRRAAVVGLIAAADVPIVKYSVDWWRSLHQPASLLKADPTLDGLMLFTMVLGIVVFLVAVRVAAGPSVPGGVARIGGERDRSRRCHRRASGESEAVLAR